MPMFHAVVLIDHQTAKVMQFDSEKFLLETVKAHPHLTPQHHSQVRTEHEFYAAVCDALEGISEILITGSHQAQADFNHYLQKHRKALVTHIVNWETVDHPTDGQLLALARGYFEHRHGVPGASKPG